jgi:hypothetical protein
MRPGCQQLNGFGRPFFEPPIEPRFELTTTFIPAYRAANFLKHL